MRRIIACAWLAACKSNEDTERPLDPPIVLPDDPSAPAAPVGYLRFEAEGVSGTLYYPAPDDVSTDLTGISPLAYVPQSFQDAIAALTVPEIPVRAQADAPLRHGEAPWPTVIFSHGFGGYSAQSTDLTTHLASRGYYVIAPEHPSRSLGALAPCLLQSTLADCNLNFAFDPDAPDPSLVDVESALTFVRQHLAENDESAFVDLETLGVFGHSAGGGTTTSVANTLTGVDAALAMAGAGSFTTAIPTAVIGGSCDAIVPEAGEGGLASAGATASEGYRSLLGAGHMAFADLCEADLGQLGEDLKTLPDANAFFIDQMLGLATDGCDGYAPPAELACGDAYLDLAVSYPLLRDVVWRFFHKHLEGQGGGIDDAAYAELVRLE
jgi:dienelactone hydrolase